jgi:hypothetical protein
MITASLRLILVGAYNTTPSPFQGNFKLVPCRIRKALLVSKNYRRLEAGLSARPQKTAGWLPAGENYKGAEN